MGFLDKWRGVPIKLTDGEFWRGFFGLGTTSGETVTIETALQLDAVWACVNLIRNAVIMLPCVVYKDDGVTVDNASPLYDLLHDMPNLDDTASDFWAMVVLCLCLDGNFFAEKKLNGAKLVALNPLPPLAVNVCRDSRNARYYEVTENGKKRKIAEDKMFHVRGAVLPGCDRGMSPIGVVRNTVGNALAGEKTAGKMFANGMQVAGVLSSDQILKKEQRDQLGQILGQFAGSDKAGKIAVLEAGLKYQQLTINPKDAQMLEVRQFNVEQICRIFGVPPVMIGHASNGTTTWGSGIEQLILQFIKTCLGPLVKSIESAVYRDLLDEKTRKTTIVKFNMEGLLRGDSTARAEFLSKMVTNGIYTPNEARSYENKAPVDGGNKAIVNGTMTRLDTLGKTETPAPTPAARAA
ncbi:phage portal protein, HK97 family [Rhizobium sp. AN5]|uniref:phage portal protein n=1 Tax=Rhizobium sp. AN5 TaxID=1855304 RepID=UPI000BD58D4E|nr:phage portal protein [Rhizobium sp. AN5]SOC93563.1 phage portal protein, HK97 family [Rhizobium sp. AN5]